MKKRYRLRPCPFCGGNIGVPNEPEKLFTNLKCKQCGMEFAPCGETFADELELMDRRAPSPDADREALQAEIERQRRHRKWALKRLHLVFPHVMLFGRIAGKAEKRCRELEALVREADWLIENYPVREMPALEEEREWTRRYAAWTDRAEAVLAGQPQEAQD